MKNYILVAMLFTMPAIPAYAQGPQCSSVFHVYSPEKVDLVLEDLARLNLQLDLAKAQGTQSILSHKLRDKTQEVMTALGISRHELREQLRSRIALLQNENRKSREDETKVRKSEESLIPDLPRFKFRDEFETTHMDHGVLAADFENFTYRQLVNSVGRDIHLWHFKKGTTRATQLTDRLLTAEISNDKKSIYGLTPDLQFVVYAPHTVGVKRTAGKLNLTPLQRDQLKVSVPRLSLSPQETLISVTIANHLYIVRLSDSQIIHHRPISMATNVKFRNEDEYYLFNPTLIERENLKTHETVRKELSTEGKMKSGLWLEFNDKNLIHATDRQISILDADTLEVRPSNASQQKIQWASPAPGLDGYYLASHGELKAGLFASADKDYSPSFEFNRTFGTGDPNSEVQVKDIRFTDDGKGVLIRFTEEFRSYFQIWEVDK